MASKFPAPYPFFLWSEPPGLAMNSPPRGAPNATSCVQRPHDWAVAWAVGSGLDMWGPGGRLLPPLAQPVRESLYWGLFDVVAMNLGPGTQFDFVQPLWVHMKLPNWSEYLYLCTQIAHQIPPSRWSSENQAVRKATSCFINLCQPPLSNSNVKLCIKYWW